MGSLGQVLPSGPAYSYSNNMRVLVSLIYAARTSIVLVNPYFVPNTTVLTAITAAAQRGVSVSLVTHERGDSRFLSWAQRSYYSELLAAGVRVRILPHPTVLHSKTVIVDGEVAVVGSSNLDTRSLYLHLELDIVWYDPGMAAALMRLQDERHASGVELDAVQWRRRPRGGRALETLARLASDIL